MPDLAEPLVGKEVLALAADSSGFDGTLEMNQCWVRIGAIQSGV